jgi:hypothetical protein
MKSLSEATLGMACEVFAVANTPAYLIRKLRQDPEISEISRSISDEEILAALRLAVKEDCAILLNAVRPYAYLVALSMKSKNDVAPPVVEGWAAERSLNATRLSLSVPVVPPFQSHPNAL